MASSPWSAKKSAAFKAGFLIVKPEQAEKLQQIFSLFFDDYESLRYGLIPSSYQQCIDNGLLFDKIVGKEDVKLAILRDEIDAFVESFEGDKNYDFMERRATYDRLSLELKVMIKKTTELRTELEEQDGARYMEGRPMFNLIGDRRKIVEESPERAFRPDKGIRETSRRSCSFTSSRSQLSTTSSNTPSADLSDEQNLRVRSNIEVLAGSVIHTQGKHSRGLTQDFDTRRRTNSSSSSEAFWNDSYTLATDAIQNSQLSALTSRAVRLMQYDPSPPSPGRFSTTPAEAPPPHPQLPNLLNYSPLPLQPIPHPQSAVTFDVCEKLVRSIVAEVSKQPTFEQRERMIKEQEKEIEQLKLEFGYVDQERNDLRNENDDLKEGLEWLREESTKLNGGKPLKRPRPDAIQKSILEGNGRFLQVSGDGPPSPRMESPEPENAPNGKGPKDKAKKTSAKAKIKANEKERDPSIARVSSPTRHVSLGEENSSLLKSPKRPDTIIRDVYDVVTSEEERPGRKKARVAKKAKRPTVKAKLWNVPKKRYFLVDPKAAVQGKN